VNATGKVQMGWITERLLVTDHET